METIVGSTARRVLGTGSPLAALGTIVAGGVSDVEPVAVTLLLRRRAMPPPVDAAGALPPRRREFLSSEQLEEKYGADPNDIARVRAFADKHALEVRHVSPAQRLVTLTGRSADIARAFSVGFARFAWNGALFRGHLGRPSVSADVAPAVIAVLGLDNRPVARPGIAFHPGFRPVDLARAHAVAVAAAQTRIANSAPQILNRLHLELAGDAVMKGCNSAIGSALGEAMLSTLAGKPRAWGLAGIVGPAAMARQRAGELAVPYQAELDNLVPDVSGAALLAYLNALGIHTPPQVGELYDFPAGSNGSGQCIGIIELGGGYFPADLDIYFKQIGVPKPTLVDVSVMGGANRPLLNPIVDSEVYLDLEVAGSLAPGARLACYFGPCTAQGFVGAISAALHDRVNRPSTISISWSISESLWIGAPAVVAAFEDVLQDAALLGVTVCCASGDYGATSEMYDGRAWVDYPSSSPHILSCGGTTIYGARGAWGQTAWNTLAIQGQATGGGISELFPLPEWQQHAQVPPSINYGGRVGRGIPDVASLSNPLTGYFVRVNGTNTAMAGTSSAAPLWCALIARIAQSIGTRLGYVNPLLYRLAGTGAFQDILLGHNGGYRAGPGWDACTGLGAPIGTKLLEALKTEH
jgi:kumamolisin